MLIKQMIHTGLCFKTEGNGTELKAFSKPKSATPSGFVAFTSPSPQPWSPSQPCLGNLAQLLFYSIEIHVHTSVSTHAILEYVHK